MESKILDVFTEVQQSSSAHRSGHKKLFQIFQLDGKKEVVQDVMLHGIIDKLLIHGKKEVAIDRVIKFICEFTTAIHSEASGDVLVVAILDHLLKRSTANDKVVRYRSCELLAKILANMSSETEISDDLWNNMITALTPRLKDKAPNVRLWAIKAAYRLQNPNDENDVIMSEICRLMTSDTIKDVRVAATELISITKVTLPLLVERVKDIKTEVRVAAINHLAKDVDVRHLTATYRATIVRFGLNDRDADVNRATRELILKWLDRTALDNRVHKLLQLINLQNNEEEAELVGLTIMAEVDKSSNSDPEIDNKTTDTLKITSSLKQAVATQCPDWNTGFKGISASEVLWALLRCEYAFAHYAPHAAAQVKETLIPDTVKLCELLNQANETGDLHNNVQNQLTVRYLLRMTAFIDTSDITGNQQLMNVCSTMMNNIYLPELLIEPVLSAWWRGSGLSVIDCVGKIIEISQNIHHSNGSTEEEEEEIKILTSIRSMLLIEWAIQKVTGKKQSNPTDLFASVSNYLLENLQQPIIELRGLAIRCIGLLTLYSTSYCDLYHDIIIQVVKTDLEDPLVRCQALQAVVDMAIVYNDRYTNDAILTHLLLRLHDCTSEPSLLRISAESTAKLLFTGRLTDPRLFANLLKFFFVPEFLNNNNNNDEENEEENEKATGLGSLVRLQQILSVFFQSFFMTGEGREQLAILSTGELVGDIALLVRDDSSVDISIMNKVINHLLILCDSMNNNCSTVNVTNVRHSICMRVTSTLGREILKLSGSKGKNSKLIIKEYIKIIGQLNDYGWLNEFSSNMSIMKALYNMSIVIMKTCASLEKASMKILEKICQLCYTFISKSDNSFDNASEGNDFYTSAPGLADLLEGADTSVNGIDAQYNVNLIIAINTNTTVPTKKGSTSRSKSVKMIDSNDNNDDDDENECDDDDDDNEMETDENNEIKENITTKSGRQIRATRNTLKC